MKLLEFSNKLAEVNARPIKDLDEVWALEYDRGIIYLNNYDSEEYYLGDEPPKVRHRMYLNTNPETIHEYSIKVAESSDFSKSRLAVIKLFIKLVETGVRNIDIEEYMNSLDKDDKNRIRYEEWKKAPYGFDREDDNIGEIRWF